MFIQPVVLWTDALVYILVISIIAFLIYVSRHEHLRMPWRQVSGRRLGMIALVVLMSFALIGLLDSLHFRQALPKNENDNGKTYYASQVVSALDVILSPIDKEYEKSYSAPFSIQLYSKHIYKLPDGSDIRGYPRLRYAAQHLQSSNEVTQDVTKIASIATAKAFLFWIIITSLFIAIFAKRESNSWWRQCCAIFSGKTVIAWREILITLGLLLCIAWIAKELSLHYHIFGTDKVGRDVFYVTLKSIRTGLLIGTLTTLVMLPFAILLGTSAGYFTGLIDDVIQYIYTTLSSIPGVLLITAAILSLQVYIANHPDLFPTLDYRADARLLALCVILGITSWTGLCRLLRGETLKIREIDYVRAAYAMGVNHGKIITRHIVPNVMHIILITIVLDFSGLVLAEAVLSYVGVGVDPTTMSWGNMINSARLELAREPFVWWPLLAAFTFMFTLVLAANLFADCVRDAFDPRLRNVTTRA